MSTRLVGDINLLGFLNLDESVFAGYEKITMEVSIDADASDEEIEDLLADVDVRLVSGYGGKVHAGFKRAYGTVRARVREQVAATLDKLSTTSH